MSMGPMPVSKRTTLAELVVKDPGLLERGLVLVESEIEIGPVRLDLLCADPGRRPVLVYLAGSPVEEQEIPLRVLDGDAAFRRHAPVLRKLFPGKGVDWDLPPRSLVVAEELSRRTMERFQAMTALEVDLLEMRSIRVKGELLWAAVPVGGEAALKSLLPPEEAPEALEDPRSRGLWNRVLERILKLDEGLEVLADKFYREISAHGVSLATLESGSRNFKVIVPRTNGSLESDKPPLVVRVEGEEEADRAVDLVIRRYLAIQEKLGASPRPREARLSWRDEEDLSLQGLERAVHSSRLTEEEISAFLEGEGPPGEGMN